MEPANFVKAIHLDYYPFAFKKGSLATSIFSKPDLEKVMKSWTKNVLRPLHELSNVKIAFCSVATMSHYAKRIMGSVELLQTFHERDGNKFISVSTGGIVPGVHPSSMYDKKH